MRRAGDDLGDLGGSRQQSTFAQRIRRRRGQVSHEPCGGGKTMRRVVEPTIGDDLAVFTSGRPDYATRRLIAGFGLGCGGAG